MRSCGGFSLRSQTPIDALFKICLAFTPYFREGWMNGGDWMKGIVGENPATDTGRGIRIMGASGGIDVSTVQKTDMQDSE